MGRFHFIILRLHFQSNYLVNILLKYLLGEVAGTCDRKVEDMAEQAISS